MRTCTDNRPCEAAHVLGRSSTTGQQQAAPRIHANAPKEQGAARGVTGMCMMAVKMARGQRAKRRQ
eukprot:106510-Lingulodinium_polyedra.AAC.1